MLAQKQKQQGQFNRGRSDGREAPAVRGHEPVVIPIAPTSSPTADAPDPSDDVMPDVPAGSATCGMCVHFQGFKKNGQNEPMQGWCRGFGPVIMPISRKVVNGGAVVEETAAGLTTWPIQRTNDVAAAACPQFQKKHL